MTSSGPWPSIIVRPVYPSVPRVNTQAGRAVADGIGRPQSAASKAVLNALA